MCGLGLFIWPRSWNRPIRWRQLSMTFWLGYATSIAFLQIWHLFLPIAPWSAPILIFVGGLGWWRHRRQTKRYIQRSRSHLSSGKILINLVLMTCITVWLANMAMGVPTAFDTGYYHLNAVRWASDYPIVTGLANLHHRLGFNSSSMLLPSVFEFGFWRGRSSHLAFGILVCGLLIPALGESMRMLRGRKSMWGLYSIMVLGPVLVFSSMTDHIASLGTDTSTMLIILVTGMYLLSQLTHEPNRSGVCVSVILLGLAVTHKVSALFIAGPFFICILYLVWQQKTVKTLYWPLLFSVLLVGVWCWRNILLTGYVLYPSPLLSFLVPWKVPPEKLIEAKEFIESYAKWNDGPQTGSWIGSWLYTWFRYQAEYSILPVIFLGINFGVILFNGSKIKSRLSGPTMWLWVFVLFPSLIALAAWFVTAPAPRFAAGTIWFLTLGLSVAMLQNHMPAKRIYLLLLAPCFIFVFWTGISLAKGRPLWQTPGTDAGLHPLRTVETKIFTTDSMLQLHVPVKGIQSWDSALPATPEPDKRLKLLKPDEPTGGFIIAPSSPN